MADSDIKVSTEHSEISNDSQRNRDIPENEAQEVSPNDSAQVNNPIASSSKASDKNVSEDADLVVPSTSEMEEEPEWLDILGSGHLKKKVRAKGVPDSRPQRGETVIINLVGKLEDGTEFENKENLEVCIGDAEVVQGIDYALPLMDVGETAEIIIGPRFGYGSLGNPPLIPRDANLYYIVTINDVIEIKDIQTLSPDERLKTGLKKKERGNWWYQRKENHLAIQCYRKAIQYLEQESQSDNNELKEAVLKTYNNLSVAHFNIEAYDAALTSVNNVLSQEPDNIKAIYRKVKILKAMGEIEQAMSVAKNGIKIKPDSPALQDELNVLLEIKKKSTSAQKVLYRKMFKNPESSKKKDNPKTVLSVTWKWLGIITVAVGIIGAAAMKYKY